jgi:hypothetical protein
LAQPGTAKLDYESEFEFSPIVNYAAFGSAEFWPAVTEFATELLGDNFFIHGELEESLKNTDKLE